MLFLCGCSAITPINEETAIPVEATVVTEAPYPVNVGDLTFNSAPKKVAALSPALAEMIFEIGHGESIICKGEYCDYPSALADIPEAGSSANPDIDAIIEYAPEIVLTQSPIANQDIVRLSDEGITVLMLPAASNIEELYDTYRELALIFEGGITCDAIADAALSGIKEAYDNARGSCESLVFIMDVTEDGFAAVNGSSFAGSYISAFGTNIAALNESPIMTARELIAADPQVIFLAHPLTSDDIGYETSEQLTAFANGYVYVIDSTLFERPTSRLASVTASVSEKLRSDTGGAAFEGGFAVIPSVNELEEETMTANVN